MSSLSKRQKEILEVCLRAADDFVVAAHLSISVGRVRVCKTRVRRKIAKAEHFLKDMKKYRSVLYPKKEYKGV